VSFCLIIPDSWIEIDFSRREQFFYFVGNNADVCAQRYLNGTGYLYDNEWFAFASKSHIKVRLDHWPFVTKEYSRSILYDVFKVLNELAGNEERARFLYQINELCCNNCGRLGGSWLQCPCHSRFRKETA
jgi:hypothetical protein